MNEQPLRIAQIIGKWVGGGVEAVVMNYYRNIDHSKIQFDFICDSDSTNIPYDEIKKLGGKVILIPPYQKVISYHRELKKVLKDGNYKIVHSHINTLSVFSLFAAKCAGVPVRIAHSHSTTNKQEFKKHLLKMALRPFSKVFATDYMCCSELAGRWLFGDKTYDKGKVYLLNNAIDLDKFAYNENIRKAKRKELKIDEDTLVIGHIGRFVEQKNHSFIIDIFDEVHKENPNSVLVLVGQGPLQDEIKEKVHTLGLDESVKFLGQRNDVGELYQAIDLFLLPSLYEGLGMVLIEAQAAGLPCVCSTEVPKIAQVTENVEFVDLQSNLQKWTSKIEENLNFLERHDTIKQISKHGYNIKLEKEMLEKYYLERV
ncbi:MAG TPA: glycosyltransferase family 1 protein [Firmicutes bacterium]|nr:glycosyltransferase family 1 protein [Bacillota bacterium]